ncbi:GumC family protein [Parasphingorhabdus cellanae]|uniref:Lipopolysaccharide biosynthesis protein n=1 Tax=Parasphingorhabdus cellanae TaxID=2806553 RepID=A0ABX7T7Q6_9SPHN|nr:Wzz/FepE/Etk N-terminal domain-containing protein [Parasphingorhabdus cellanae]QTD56250.1 lipopolysaccharide biosynthesis protein [Parasphingorhabdus cellanae]
MNIEDLDEQESEGGNFLSQIPVIIWQRKWLFIIPLLLCAAAGVAAYFLLPTVYRSQAIMLVQSSQLPDDVAGDGANEIVDRRIARIRQQVLSRPGLIELINKYELYTSDRGSDPLSEIVENMRESVEIVPMTAEVQRVGNGQSATIAFALGYEYSDPVKAQSVAQDLTEQILQLDSTVNSEQASSTEEFLMDQAAGLDAQIQTLESQIATIKAQNGDVLGNSGMMFGGGGGGYDVQIAALQRENSQLVSQREDALKSSNRDPVVASAEQQLANAKAIYSDNHPDVVIAQQRLAEAKALAEQNIAKLPVDTINQQIAFNNTQIATLRAAKARENSRISASLNAQSRAPIVLQQIEQLQQRLNGLNEQYQGVSNRLLAAQAGVKAENEQMGERLSVIDPPVIPDKPASPDWLLLSGGGLGAGLALGFLLVFGTELFLQPIRDPKTISNAMGVAPMVVIPTIKEINEEESGRSFWPFRRREAHVEEF